MIVTTISEAKAQLSKLIERARAGEKIIIDVYYEKDLILPFYTHKFKFNPVVEEKLR